MFENETEYAQAACNFVAPLTAHAYSARQFADAARKFEEWVREYGHATPYFDTINGLAQDLWLNEEAAKIWDAEADRLGLLNPERKERFEIHQDMRYANSKKEVKAIRARVYDWLERFPDDTDAAKSWGDALKYKQEMIDALAEIGAEPPSFANPYAALRAMYPDPFARTPIPDKHLVGV